MESRGKQDGRRNQYIKTEDYLLRAILMYKQSARIFTPLSYEEYLCEKEIMKYTYELEILDYGAEKEREEVLLRYGEYIG